MKKTRLVCSYCERECFTEAARFSCCGELGHVMEQKTPCWELATQVEGLLSDFEEAKAFGEGIPLGFVHWEKALKEALTRVKAEAV